MEAGWAPQPTWIVSKKCPSPKWIRTPDVRYEIKKKSMIVYANVRPRANNSRYAGKNFMKSGTGRAICRKKFHEIRDRQGYMQKEIS
jgi:hypothetical protein